MKYLLAVLLAILTLMLSACGYWVVEDAPIQVGSAIVTAEPQENVR